ncbi:MAG TPA: 16S rRNA (cytosine(1402)-N(4))-methyltransferase RsmH [Bacilli bacterium]|nr:16S rRNA (cytosine(1402)-N(4))-methyltransferase RsmH [Bacilli bacterium]
MKHYSVLKKEAVDNLNINSEGIYVDATLGYAGDSLEILRKLKRGFLFAFDQDLEAINYSEKELTRIGHNFKLIHSNFVNLKEELAKLNVTKVDGILFDLGLSSPQIDNPKRGFSFMSDATLDMRMNKDQKLDAKYIVNNYSEKELINIFFKYGEEKFSKNIAKNICLKRAVEEIARTNELVEIIRLSVPYKYFKEHHPERKIFQAIRIAVNQELDSLEKVLPDAIDLLNKGGRICVITFHSLEDRIVKQIFKKYSDIDPIVKGLKDIPDDYKPIIKLINKKPIVPKEEELEENSRSKSAKLRVIERL